MIKRITLDTNADLIGQASALYIEVINDDTGILVTLTPTFTELEIESTPTGVYNADIDLSPGKYSIFIKHDSLDKSGFIRTVVSNETTYEELGVNIFELDTLVNEQDDSISFS